MFHPADFLSSGKQWEGVNPFNSSFRRYQYKIRKLVKTNLPYNRPDYQTIYIPLNMHYHSTYYLAICLVLATVENHEGKMHSPPGGKTRRRKTFKSLSRSNGSNIDVLA